MKTILQLSRIALAVNLMVWSTGVGYAAMGPAPILIHTPVMMRALPIYFEANRGQAGDAIKFLARGPGYQLLLTSTEATLIHERQETRIHLLGSNPHPVLEGRGLLPGKSNYFFGNDSTKWRANVPHYSQVVYKQVYPGIDMIYAGDPQSLEYSFIVAPGANADQILMNFAGARRPRVNSAGSLILSFKTGADLVFKAPSLYQNISGERLPVRGRFVVTENNWIHFEVGDYLRTQELVIDPTLDYSTYLGTTVADQANAMRVDGAGNVYLTGQTAGSNFPGTAGHFQSANNGGAWDVFVTKISPAGTLVWSTYLGGAGDDMGNAIAVDATNIVYITGSTTITAGVKYPTKNAYQAVNNGGTDAFVTAIAADGNSLVYSTFLGGAGVEFGNGITLDGSNNAYVTGGTTSNNTTFPSTAGAYQTDNGVPGGPIPNAFVAKFNSAGGIGYMTYLGGSVTGGTQGNAIAVDGTGNAFVTGFCRDTFPIFPFAAFPAARAFKQTITGSQDAFVSKISPSGANLLYSTYLGGSGVASGTGIKLDSTGNVYVTGDNDSTDFPDAGSDGVTTGMSKVGQTTVVGAPDCFIFKIALNATGHNDGVYCTFLGGSGVDHADALVVDGSGDAYVTGRTASGDFLTAGPGSIQTPLYTVQNGTAKAFVTEIGPAGNTRVFNTFIGGVTDQEGKGIGLDAANNLYVAGWTNSTDFPIAGSAPMPLFAANAGSSDAFVLKIAALTPPLPPPPSGQPAAGFSLSPITGPDVGDTTVIITGTGLTGATRVTFDGVNAQSFTVDSNTRITAHSPAHAAGPAVNVVVTLVGGNSTAGAYTYFATPSAGAGTYLFPSPVNGPTASVAYVMAEAGTAEIRVYNEIGDLVTKVDDVKPAGAQVSTFRTAWLAPGVYFYILNLNYNSGNSDKRKLKKFVVKH